MNRLEKRLVVFALVFVIVYLGAVALTIHSRIQKRNEIARLESAEAVPGESHVMLAELFLPMLILLTVTLCFIIVKRKRDRDRQRLDQEPEREPEDNAEFS